MVSRTNRSLPIAVLSTLYFVEETVTGGYRSPLRSLDNSTKLEDGVTAMVRPTYTSVVARIISVAVATINAGTGQPAANLILTAK
ncbi:MAG: hypothetical protein D4R73_00450 [Deltaproteobacteria bacterium]|nr:MAG: hypothetical protein D4R73_00450 [Deltaproteobacteria bacterium]